MTPSSDYWFTYALANYASFDYSGFLVATDVNKELAASAQEMIIVTPEPSSAILLLTGLLLVFGAVAIGTRRRTSRVFPELGRAESPRPSSRAT